MDCVGRSGSGIESFYAVLSISVPPVVECPSWDPCAGADFVDWRPLPTSSYAPASELHNVSRFLHAGTLSHSSYECATCCGLLQFASTDNNIYNFIFDLCIQVSVFVGGAYWD